ncbi:MAG TPA: aromatic aminobenezylarsenical efflux permease ArsG family transporter [Candidatus Dependentiae bacterium]|nr:aromatic aminobenezylarsenical efflux permease ArsG family transporter [Candidatus Dependentiae bacterium]
MSFLNYLIYQYNIPLLTAFLLGVLTSISPCPLVVNITAIAYLSKNIKSAKNTILNGLWYTFGRVLSYTFIAVIVYYGVSSFSVSTIFQGWGEKLLGPVLIFIGVIMLSGIKIGGKLVHGKLEAIKQKLATQGYAGSLLLGMILALAFCPYSAALFFGALMPLILSSPEKLLLAPVFGLGTGIPIIIFAFILAYSVQKIGATFAMVQKLERLMRILVAIIFILAGVYFLRFWMF